MVDTEGFHLSCGEATPLDNPDMWFLKNDYFDYHFFFKISFLDNYEIYFASSPTSFKEILVRYWSLLFRCLFFGINESIKNGKLNQYKLMTLIFKVPFYQSKDNANGKVFTELKLLVLVQIFWKSATVERKISSLYLLHIKWFAKMSLINNV